MFLFEFEIHDECGQLTAKELLGGLRGTPPVVTQQRVADRPMAGIAEGRGAGPMAVTAAPKRMEVGDLAGVGSWRFQHLGLGRLQHAVEPAQDDHRQDEPPVLRLLVVAPQQVSHRPDERRVVAAGLAVCSRHNFSPRSSSTGSILA